MRVHTEVHAMAQESPALAETPAHKEEAPQTLGEMEKRRAEAEKLEDIGRSLESSPTQQLAQMAVEAGPSMLGGEEPARKKLWLTMGGKAPQRNSSRPEKWRCPIRYWLGTVALLKLHWFLKSTDVLIHKLPFSHLVHKIAPEVGWYDMCLHMHSIMTLQEAAEAYLVGILEGANLCAIHMKCITIMPIDIQLAQHICGEHLQYWVTFSPKSVSVFLLVVGCVGFCQYQGRELSVGFAMYMLLLGTIGFIFVSSP